jgi:tripartite-type tricarboxylate transporter receptor subunit TctC
MRLKTVVAWFVLGAGIAAQTPHALALFPDRPIRVITGFAAAGVSDVIVRTVGEQLGRQLGQRLIIDTRPGAGSLVSMGIAAAATPDGYTLHLATPALSLSPLFVDRQLGFDPLKAFAGVSLLGTGPTVMAAHPRLAVKSTRELIDYAKARPGELKVGHSGEGSIQHLAGELFRVTSGANLTPVAYRSAQASLFAALQGEVELVFSPLSSALTHLQAGRLRALGVTSARRAKAAPEIPSIAETLPGYDVFSWYALVVPAATPRAIVGRLNDEIRKALAEPAVYEQLERQGIEAQHNTPEQLQALMVKDHQRWAKLVKDAGITLR